MLKTDGIALSVPAKTQPPNIYHSNLVSIFINLTSRPVCPSDLLSLRDLVKMPFRERIALLRCGVIPWSSNNGGVGRTTGPDHTFRCGSIQRVSGFRHSGGGSHK